ncbi:MAG: ACP S-malonyltransferase [Pseudomonadota bacterium]
MTSTTAVAVFPGQGAQRVGMGQALADVSQAARAVFEEVDTALGESLSSLIFNGPQEELTLTANAQPALMATSLAAVRAFEEAQNTALQNVVALAAGHSLGEYSALAAAGALSITDAARLLRLRGEAMQAAVPIGEGAMAVILGLDVDAVEAVAAAASEQCDGEVCELANDNAEGQAVLSGHRRAVEAAVPLAKEKGARRSMLLDVSAPFHCALMAPAAERLGEALANTRFATPTRPVIANVTAAAVSDADQFPALLVEQVTARVRWRETMQTMGSMGCDRIVEFGAGRVLTGLARRALPQATLLNIGEPADLDALQQNT